ncbi:unnamed protein product [Brassica napus]|nr:unnamed protein product [Brassica napus]
MKSTANYVPLTPISFLDRSAVVYADRTSVVYGPVTYTWRQTRDCCVRVASASLPTRYLLRRCGQNLFFTFCVFGVGSKRASYGRVTFRCSHGWSFALYTQHPPRLRTRIRFC